jgi:hypothetical protein
MLSYFSTQNQRLAVTLATLGIQPSSKNPVSKEETDSEKRITFHFEPVGTWTPFGGHPETPIRAEEVASAFHEQPSKLPPEVLEELKGLRAAMRFPGTFQAMRKSSDPSVSYLALAASENASILAKLAEAAPTYRRRRIRGGTLHAPVDRWEEAVKTFKSFQ